MKTSLFFRPAIFTATILLIPLIAMQFTSEVQWTLSDFIIMGLLLFGAGTAYEFLARQTGKLAYRGGAALAVGACLLLTWMNMAVGIIGNEKSDINMLYFLIPMIVFLGAIKSRLNALLLARTMYAAAAALALIPIIALIINRPTFSTPEDYFGLLGLFILHTFFVTLFVGSGLLFKQASQSPAN